MGALGDSKSLNEVGIRTNRQFLLLEHIVEEASNQLRQAFLLHHAEKHSIVRHSVSAVRWGGAKGRWIGWLQTAFGSYH